MVSDTGDREVAAAAFPATLQGARAARLWLQEALAPLALGGWHNSAFAVSLMELASNIVDHAPMPGDGFTVRLLQRAGALRLELSANTRSFASPAEFRRLLQRDATDVLSDRGRGLIMVGHYFPDAAYRSPGPANEPECYVLEYRCRDGARQT